MGGCAPRLHSKGHSLALWRNTEYSRLLEMARDAFTPSHSDCLALDGLGLAQPDRLEQAQGV